MSLRFSSRSSVPAQSTMRHSCCSRLEGSDREEMEVSVREVRAAGREALTLATELLQRARRADRRQVSGKPRMCSGGGGSHGALTASSSSSGLTVKGPSLGYCLRAGPTLPGSVTRSSFRVRRVSSRKLCGHGLWSKSVCTQWAGLRCLCATMIGLQGVGRGFRSCRRGAVEHRVDGCRRSSERAVAC